MSPAQPPCVMTISSRAHEHYVGRLNGDVGAGADCDSQVRLRERGRVVDAITDHSHLLAGALQLGDLSRLVAGKNLGDHFPDAELPADAFCGGSIVARQHHNFDAQPLQGDDRCSGAEVVALPFLE